MEFFKRIFGQGKTGGPEVPPEAEWKAPRTGDAIATPHPPITPEDTQRLETELAHMGPAGQPALSEQEQAELQSIAENEQVTALHGAVGYGINRDMGGRYQYYTVGEDVSGGQDAEYPIRFFKINGHQLVSDQEVGLLQDPDITLDVMAHVGKEETMLGKLYWGDIKAIYRNGEWISPRELGYNTDLPHPEETLHAAPALVDRPQGETEPSAPWEMSSPSATSEVETTSHRS